MSNRLSYASSPDSDLDMRPGSKLYDDDEDNAMYPMHNNAGFGGPVSQGPVRGRRLIRSSSDPSIATGENVPGIPPYPAPPTYQQKRGRESRVMNTAVSMNEEEFSEKFTKMYIEINVQEIKM